MGVTQKIDNTSFIQTGRSEESLSSLGLSSVPQTPPSEADLPITLETQPQQSNKLLKDPSLLIQRLQDNVKRVGARKARRYENAKILESLAEEPEEFCGVPSIEDFKPKLNTAFTRLFNSFDDMRIWQYFMTCSEVEQLEYLQNLQPQKTSKEGAKSCLAAYFTNKPLIDEEVTTSDPRAVDPSFSPAERYKAIEPWLRKALRVRRLPMHILSCLETDVVSAFVQDPTAVLISEELPPFDKTLLLCACQYNLLYAKGFPRKPSRLLVENKRKIFDPPKQSLVEYIENSLKFRRR